MSMHPHGEQISAYIDGMLDVTQTRQVAQHLPACASCHATYRALKRTKTLLREVVPPQTPGPEFWTNTYRRLRVEGDSRPSLGETWGRGLRQAWSGTHRRWAAGAAAAAVLAAAVAAPLVMHTVPPINSVVQPSADFVDISSLVRAHTQSAARQPLADPDRQTMISADTDDAPAFGDTTLETAGDGGSFATDAAR